jgi:hypothetical protein
MRRMHGLLLFFLKRKINLLIPQIGNSININSSPLELDQNALPLPQNSVVVTSDLFGPRLWW